MNNLLIILLAFFLNKDLAVMSPSFANNTNIPSKYTCDGENINPQIIVTDIPATTKSLALIMEDPDAPVTFDHWVMYNIPPDGNIAENSAPGIQGVNGKLINKYIGPCPPTGTHHYHIRVYALDMMLNLGVGASKKSVKAAMLGHILASGELVGLYKKINSGVQSK